MADMIQLYDATDEGMKRSPGAQRRIAVEAALELIRASGLGSADLDRLDVHMNNLGKYADAIQKALEVKQS